MSASKSENTGVETPPEQTDDFTLNGQYARELHEALDDIRFIRGLVDNSRDYFISGWSAVAWGLALIAGSVLTSYFMNNPPEWGLSETLWALWIVLGSAAAGVEAYFMYRLTLRAGKRLFSPYLLKVLAADAVMVLQGIVLTLIFIEVGRPEYIPGAFLLAMSGIVIGTGIFIKLEISVYGFITLVFSLVALLLPEVGLWCVMIFGIVSVLVGLWYLVVHKK